MTTITIFTYKPLHVNAQSGTGCVLTRATRNHFNRFQTIPLNPFKMAHNTPTPRYGIHTPNHTINPPQPLPMPFNATPRATHPRATQPRATPNQPTNQPGLHVIQLHVIRLHVIQLHVIRLHVIQLHVIRLHVIQPGQTIFQPTNPTNAPPRQAQPIKDIAPLGSVTESLRRIQSSRAFGWQSRQQITTEVLR